MKLEPKAESRGNDTAYRDMETKVDKHRVNISKFLDLSREGQNM